MNKSVIIIFCIFLYLCSGIDEGHGEGEDKKTVVKDYAQVKVDKGEDVVFAEVFDDTWGKRWVVSEDKQYEGKWTVSEGDPPYGISQDKGLIVESIAKKHAISAEFFKILDNHDKDLFIQYELRLQKDLDCGGAYIKLLTDNQLDLKKFNNEVPYTIMFGPDKCGANNKVHFIVRHKNPISGKYEEKHLKNPPPIKVDTKTHLYSLHIFKDNTFKILIDNEEVRTGSLLEDFDPPFNPPEEIDDPEDKKPKDWVDEPKISDPDAVKPDDWDETAPATIVDVNDEKPDTWLDNEPLDIPDPEATKPADWDDDLDGEWEPPLIHNPKCADGQCGTWKPRYIANPAYKGKWKPPLIDNPNYIGEWAPRKIPNPYYFVDEHPHNLDKMRAIGIEIWTMKDRIFFDNFIISYKKGEVDKFTSIWEQRNDDEEIIEAEEKAKLSPPILDQITAFAKNNVLLVVVIVVVLLVSIVFCFCFPSLPPATSTPATASATTAPSTTSSPATKTPPKKKQKAD